MSEKMSYLHILLLTALLSFPLAQQVNASIDCSEYKMTTSVVYNTLRYDLSNNGYIDPPFVDSIWITDRDTTNYLLVSHAQSMEAIDISMLARGYYLLWVRVGECLYGARFGKQTYAEALDDIPAEAPTRKILREGQLLIQHNEKTYNAEGVKLR